MAVKAHSLFEPEILRQAAVASFSKLHPRSLMKNPVMFVTEVGAFLTTVGLFFRPSNEPMGFGLQVAVWLWFTVLFANFAEAMAEGRGKAQADALRKTRTQTMANRLRKDGSPETVPAEQLRKEDVVIVIAGEIIPGDGTVIEGVASVDESAITGESAPVIREAGGDRSAVTGGTRVLSDRIKVVITANPGESFLDRMIQLVEGASRQKTPNEIALTILLSALTIIFLVVVMTLKFFGIYSGVSFSVTVLVALLVCLIPTTIGGLLSAIGIAGIDRLVQKNVLAMSGRAVEAAGDVNVLLLDKTGTITLGDRQATEFLPAKGVSVEELADAAQLASLADETPEGRSIVVLAKQFGLRGRNLSEMPEAHFIAFSAQTRMSGVDVDGRKIRKGAADSVKNFAGGRFPAEVEDAITRVAFQGGTPLVVADNDRILGTVYLKDIVKGGLSDRFERFRAMGIRTVMITGDNPLTAAAIAREAGVDDFLAEATPDGQAGAHPEGTGRRLPRGHDRGRHQRRPRPGAGRRGSGDEHGDPGRQGSGEHGGPGFQSHQAHRDRGDRQADAHDAGGAHDLQHRQRRGEIFRHPPGHADRGVPGDRTAEHHAAGFPPERDLERRHLQRAHHRRPHPPGPARGSLPAVGRGSAPASQPPHLRVGRRAASLSGDQAHRHRREHCSILCEEGDPMKDLIAELRASIAATLLLAVLCCGIYPAVVWAVGQGLFSGKANGSLIRVDGNVVGSSLLAQGFTAPNYFHPRPSAAGQGYDAVNSGGTNLGPTSKKLIEDVKQRIADYRAENDLSSDTPVPADAVTSSASGLDPHISVRNALLQAARVAKARGIGEKDVLAKVRAHTEGRTFRIPGGTQGKRPDAEPVAGR